MGGCFIKIARVGNTCLMSQSQSDNLPLLKIFRQSDYSGKIALALATWFGSGLLPIAPGTFGTIAAVPLILGLHNFGIWHNVFALVIIIGVSIWAAGRYQKLLRQNDPPKVVIDEVAGFSLTMFLLPPSWPILGLGFILFRFFDILKPYPIRRLEKLRGGFGIVADDLLAGLYSQLGLRIVLVLLQ
jgi:phosphatidylglycerophosphatase A